MMGLSWFLYAWLALGCPSRVGEGEAGLEGEVLDDMMRFCQRRSESKRDDDIPRECPQRDVPKDLSRVE